MLSIYDNGEDQFLPSHMKALHQQSFEPKPFAIQSSQPLSQKSKNTYCTHSKPRMLYTNRVLNQKLPTWIHSAPSRMHPTPTPILIVV